MGYPKNLDKRKAVQDERARRMGELIAAPMLTLADIALYLDLPVSTLHKLRAQGNGPRTFKIGRKLYATRPAVNEWLDHMAKASGDH
jgi:predicted DNA-binding transcriptional regulator AlpA